MSDDEEYYDDYDEDVFWVEEPDPTVADDLAATATITNDAIFYDDPALEAEEFFSDWDDLSDDYFDDDSTAVKRQRALNLLSRPVTLPNKPRVPASKVPKFDIAAFQGTVWKSPSDEVKIAVHEPGEGEKVALLKNWREVFRNSHPAIGRVRARIGGDGVGAGSREETEDGDGYEGEEEYEYEDEDEEADEGEGGADGDYDSGVGGVEDGVVKVSSELSNGLGSEVNGAEDAPDAAEPIQSQPLKESKANGVEKPTTKGRKRKAEDADEPAPELTGNPRSKRIATQKVGETKETHPASSGPVRRSARNKK
ncbi:hypothetical protein BO70DRAFT_425791 [Aspergillus heteromorphus CBS 117.55]|uniref:Uncharacterized protein n=1 Tax=Aspergillus heteromorphus CBS 117.55 TaxID=1448321 RepID=A0A317WY06_9EURO|nr:uncharacterized protein BO70DRAFT_425791 [Aspergillus heteromorphus CBS 117.55]PWY90855.1 hypothetical protein BO70DRAFT_425791 [Aspergillus heteromorphus CBS 117.55]